MRTMLCFYVALLLYSINKSLTWLCTINVNNGRVPGINSLTKESVVTQKVLEPWEDPKNEQKRKFSCLKIHETKKAHTR